MAKRSEVYGESFMTKKMKDEHILRWLVEYGLDWVDERTISGTWADTAFYWYGAVKDALLEEKQWDEVTGNDHKATRRAYKLTPRAIKRLGEDRDARF